MNQRKNILASLTIVFLLTVFTSCKTHYSKEYKLLQGKWEMILYDNQDTKGQFYFKDSLLKFKRDFVTEEAIFKIKKDTLFLQRIGGMANFLSSEEYWIIDKITVNIFKIHSNRGIIVTAYKPELTNPDTGAPISK